MATQLDIVNKLLVRMRETRVTSTQDTPYAALLAQIVADSYQEVLDEWNWETLNKVARIAVPAGSTTVEVTSVVSGTLPTADVLLTRLHGDGYTMWLAEGATQGVPVAEADLSDLRLQGLVDGFVESEFPMYFAIAPDLETNTVTLEFSETPLNDLTLVMQFTKRESTMLSDGTTDTSVIDVPVRAVETLAYMYALNERGEEMGEAGNLAERRYIQALSTAKEKDIKAKEHGNRLDWRRD